jgi:hypothetical protein
VQGSVADFSAGCNSGTAVTNSSGGEAHLAASPPSGIFTSAPSDSQSGAAPAERPAPRPAPRWPLRYPAAALPRPLAAARYLQYRVKLTSTSASLTAALYDITFVWDLIVKKTSA